MQFLKDGTPKLRDAIILYLEKKFPPQYNEQSKICPRCRRPWEAHSDYKPPTEGEDEFRPTMTIFAACYASCKGSNGNTAA